MEEAAEEKNRVADLVVTVLVVLVATRIPLRSQEPAEGHSATLAPTEN
jgi:hypothetical protein